MIISDNGILDLEAWPQLLTGDGKAFEALYRRHAKTVLRYAWSLLQDQGLAEEALQETFLIAWRKRRSSRLVDESLLPWLLAICRNERRNVLRRAVRHRAVSIDALGREMEASSEEADGRLVWIADELDKLSPVDRQVCELCLVEGYSYAEAAQILDSTEAAVGKRLQRARARLQQGVLSNK